MADVFTILETDHRNVERTLELLAGSEPGPERDTAVAGLVACLTLHMQFEESKIYPLLQQVDAEMEQEAETEHDQARDALINVQQLVSEPGFRAAVETLKRGISHHVQEEETEAFPK